MTWWHIFFGTVFDKLLNGYYQHIQWFIYLQHSYHRNKNHHTIHNNQPAIDLHDHWYCLKKTKYSHHEHLQIPTKMSYIACHLPCHWGHSKAHIQMTHAKLYFLSPFSIMIILSDRWFTLIALSISFEWRKISTPP